MPSAQMAANDPLSSKTINGVERVVHRKKGWDTDPNIDAESYRIIRSTKYKLDLVIIARRETLVSLDQRPVTPSPLWCPTCECL